MERRKFIAGLGSLTAAGAAGIGTGALSATQADRTVTAEVVGDQSGYMGLTPYGENSEFASIQDGELTLNFGKDFNTPGQTNGEGLSQDSINWFDGVFRVYANDNGGAFDVWIESNEEALSFYWSSKKSGATTKSNSVTLDVDGNTNVDVGVKINLDDYENTGDIFTGDDNFTIHAEDTN